jgi:putative sigma-54 modulation protein
MNINFEYDSVAASDRLEIFTAQKVQKLIDHHDTIVAIDVYFKSKNTKSDTNERVCGIRLNVPGTTLFSESRSDNFENSVTSTISELQRQLRKYKEKLRTY